METPKPRGRPRKPEGERLVILGIAMHADTIAELRAVCELVGLTQTRLVESALQRECKRLRRQYTRKR
jgi:hypothetical protein